MSSDLISRRAAISLAKDICVPDKDGSVYRHRCIDPYDITELSSAQQWIPCSERLPEDGTYLCWESQGFCYIDVFKNGNWNLHNQLNANCIAWMPLPEPYKEKRQ